MDSRETYKNETGKNPHYYDGISLNITNDYLYWLEKQYLITQNQKKPTISTTVLGFGPNTKTIIKKPHKNKNQFLPPPSAQNPTAKDITKLNNILVELEQIKTTIEKILVNNKNK